VEQKGTNLKLRLLSAFLSFPGGDLATNGSNQGIVTIVQPIGTAIRWQYSHDGGVSWLSFVPGEEEELDGSEEELLLRARLTTSNPHISPALNLRDIQWIGYQSNASSTFVTHELKLSQGVYMARLYAEMSVPSGSSVAWFGSTDNGVTWEPMVLTGTQPLDDVWTEFAFERIFAQTWRRDFRFKAVLSTNGHEAPRLNILGITFL